MNAVYDYQIISEPLMPSALKRLHLMSDCTLLRPGRNSAVDQLRSLGLIFVWVDGGIPGVGYCRPTRLGLERRQQPLAAFMDPKPYKEVSHLFPLTELRFLRHIGFLKYCNSTHYWSTVDNHEFIVKSRIKEAAEFSKRMDDLKLNH